MRLNIAELARNIGGSVFVDGARAQAPDGAVVGATQDSRSVEPGQLFVPLIVERNGHDFIEGAIAAGAGAYLTSEPPGPGLAIAVHDTMEALSAAGRYARSLVAGPVVGITGSVGKTSAKDLLAGALAATRPTHASTKSFNNEIGVPLTLLNTPDDAEAVVLEMGARGIGHIATLCEVASPTVGIVTTVAGAHMGEFGSIENIAIAKGELVESLPDTGLAVLNAGNPYIAGMASRTRANVLTFGLADDVEQTAPSVVVNRIELDDELRATFTIDSDWGEVVARPQMRGAHMAGNVAAAVGAALWLGSSIADVEAGIADAAVSPWRMEVFRSAGGALIINDSYNANPTSMMGAIDSLARVAEPRKIAVVGYMGELGPDEAKEHQAIASALTHRGIEMIAVGTDLYGSDPRENPLDVEAELAALDETSAVLIKGSRSAGLEKLAEVLR